MQPLLRQWVGPYAVLQGQVGDSLAPSWHNDHTLHVYWLIAVVGLPQPVTTPLELHFTACFVTHLCCHSA